MEKNVLKILSLMNEIKGIMKDAGAIAIYISSGDSYLQLDGVEIENAEIVPHSEKYNAAKTIIDGVEVMKLVDKEEAK